MIAAISTTVATFIGFAYLFAVWAGSSEITDEDKLRLAAAQYVAGNVKVAGNLAAQVVLPDDKPIALDTDGQPTGEAEIPDEGADAEPEAIIDEGPGGDDTVAEPAEAADKPDGWLPLQKFLVGAGLFQEAIELELPADRRERLKEAVPYLEKANKLGFPPGRDADGYRMLGIAHQELGDYEKATQYLQEAIQRDLTMRDELKPLLAISSARRPREDLSEAIVAIDEVLAQESLDRQKRTESELLKIQWLIQLKRFDQAERVIENAKTRIQPAVEVQDRWALNAADSLLLAHAHRVVEEVLSGIEPTLGEVLAAGVPTKAHLQVSPSQRTELLDLIKDLTVMQREAAPKLAAQSRITAGQALLLAGETSLALAEFTQVRQQRPFSEEGLEGGLSEMELLAEDSLGEDVLQTSRYLVREISQSRHLNFTNKRESDFQSRIKNVLARLRGAGEYQSTVEIADAVTSLFGVDAASTEKAIAYRDWGDATLKDGRGPGGETSREAFEVARSKYREAGDAFSIAANEEFNTENYVKTLWSAIDAYQRGRHFSKSIVLLEKYLRYEDRMRQPQGLVAHGRALLAEGQPVAAMKSLQTCIVEFERDPMRYEARLLAAQAAADTKDNEQAKTLLLENLSDGKLTPQSPIWRDSLHTLGELLYAESDMAIMQTDELKLAERIDSMRVIEPKLTEALRRLNEAVERYWPSPRAQTNRYLFARGQLLAARLPEAEMQVDSLLDSAKRDFRQKSNRYRQAALDQFTALIRFLDSEERDGDLSEKQQSILRNSLLGQADTLKTMQRYVEAADAYRDMSLRYINEPPALEALLGQARMARLLGRDREADLLLAQAEDVLERIPETWDNRFEEMTRFDRDGWKRYLVWVNKRNDQVRGDKVNGSI
ncbi:hypothetical protein Pla100_49040 [Neorhodopirellula pilleata]|uniref:Uncharacterized protein n=2 Tax=Neorhodopirellula pilleata TaxID=2714738 RepID=A0A5C5ZXJ8_9BACT|nr:hypothetical protein Pla100_49040 [Neorhodopirellula pilleata]